MPAASKEMLYAPGAEKPQFQCEWLPVDTGTHYGWIQLTRPVVDKHTPFELVAYTSHPVPGEPIRAGEPPGLPGIHAEVGAEELTFSWDSRWGNLILESAENLESPEWEEVVVSAGGPVNIPVTAETQRFYRLRTLRED